MADGRQGRPVKRARDTDAGTKLTIRMDGRTKNLIADMAASYGLTIGEYLETLVNRDATRTEG
jgi:antitoxin component of RelBE/YafQ-DinJ toxin-antitoxin module